jgi:tetratricopeptide (TPR) repeat protein
MSARIAMRHLAVAGVIAALAAALYLPFLGNPWVFDDRPFFSGGPMFYFYATTPLGLGLRLPPYFSLAATETLGGSMAVHRSISLLFHIACALALYRLLYDLQRLAAQAGCGTAPVPAFDADAVARAAIVAAAFAVHPVAVYGAGYLVQRSILFATLCSLMSIILLLSGLRRGSHADAVSAALMYSLAVLSKEHAVLLPAAALPAIALAGASRRFALRHAAIYLAACAPAAICVTLLSQGWIGTTYEDAYSAIATQLEAVGNESASAHPLAMSAVTQAGLFFRYLGLWLWADPGAMSVDLRVDFAASWSASWIAVKLLAFAACGALGLALLLHGGAAGIAGFGLLYFWLLYLVEFSVARFQEPFVLYRSYLWAPGIACLVVAALWRVPRRVAIAAGAAACLALGTAARDRLSSFSSPLLLWEDAVAKLPPQPVPWASRTLYGLGREYLYAGLPDKAVEVAERCIARYPETAQCHYARGAIRLHRQDFEGARADFSHVLEIQPASAIVHHRLGLALEGLGRLEQARASYRQALQLGYQGAGLELQRLKSPGVKPASRR